MFQYVWFNRYNYTKKEMPGVLASDFAKVQIRCVRLSYWAEHCLECAVPQCYRNCAKWIERYDQKCQKFYYGIYNNSDQFHNSPYKAELKFRKWGKLETYLYPGTVDPDTARRLDSINRVLSNLLLHISKAIKYISPTCKLSRALEAFKIVILKKTRRNANEDTNTFLFEAYSQEAATFSLCLDILADNKLLYREKMTVNPGYNHIILNLPPHISLAHIIKNSTKSLARIYPENDFEAELTILHADFVELAKDPAARSPAGMEEPASKVKCVAWDLDNTVWDGTLIESDPEQLQLREHVLGTIRLLDDRGIIQIVVSKNYESEAIAVLQRLGIDHYFVYRMINWESKSGNMDHLARMLNININTFALIDDSAFERNEVSNRFPCVRVYDETVLPGLGDLAEFDVPVTEESKKRREMYQTEAIRHNIAKEYSGDNLQFLRNCEVTARVSALSNDQIILRSYELLQRTNQLNLSGKKYEKDEFFRLVTQGEQSAFVVFCSDRFGDYGQIAYFTVMLQGDTAFVLEFAMSCRVAGKYVESAIIQWLQGRYASLGARYIVFQGFNSGKNKLLIESLQEIGLENLSKGDQELVLRIETGKPPKNCDIVAIIDDVSANG